MPVITELEVEAGRSRVQGQGWRDGPEEKNTGCNSRGSNTLTLVWPPWVLYTCAAQTYTQVKMPKHIKKNLKKKEFKVIHCFS